MTPTEVAKLLQKEFPWIEYKETIFQSHVNIEVEHDVESPQYNQIQSIKHYSPPRSELQIFPSPPNRRVIKMRMKSPMRGYIRFYDVKDCKTTVLWGDLPYLINETAKIIRRWYM